MTSKTIDINCDMGEDPTGTGMNNDHLLMPFISSCNICCGEHSSTVDLIANTLRLAVQSQITIGAHPSYPDRDNFGRVVMAISDQELLDSIGKQLSELKNMVLATGGVISHVKAHGALYHQLHREDTLAEAYIALVESVLGPVAIFGMAGTALHTACDSAKFRFVAEAFLDRRYSDSNTLVSRGTSGAIISHDEDLIGQLRQLLAGEVTATDGRRYEIQAETLCLHSDHNNSIGRAQAIFRYLQQQLISLQSYAS